MHELGHDEVGDLVVDLPPDEHDPLVQKARVDVERALPAGGLLNDHRDQLAVDASDLHGAISSPVLCNSVVAHQNSNRSVAHYRGGYDRRREVWTSWLSGS